MMIRDDDDCNDVANDSTIELVIITCSRRRRNSVDMTMNITDPARG
jgi:hypothetical protein